MVFPLGADDDERAEFFLSIAGDSSIDGDDENTVVDTGRRAGRGGGDSERSCDNYLGLHGRNNSEELHIETPGNKTVLFEETSTNLEWGLRGKAESLLKDTRSRLSDTGDKLAHHSKEIAGRADDYVHDKPWTGVGIGAAVGVVIGVLLARR